MRETEESVQGRAYCRCEILPYMHKKLVKLALHFTAYGEHTHGALKGRTNKQTKHLLANTRPHLTVSLTSVNKNFFLSSFPTVKLTFLKRKILLSIPLCELFSRLALCVDDDACLSSASAAAVGVISLSAMTTREREMGNTLAFNSV